MTANRWLALPVVLVAVFMTTLDFFVVNVAVPSIRADLSAGDAALQFVVAGYGLAYAAGLIISGRLGDLFGPRRVFAAGLALFTLASLACGLAPGAGALVAARVAQGAAAALLAPQVLTLLGAIYRGADRARAFGWYGTAVGLAGVGGQVIGGLLVAADPLGLGWRACFLINLPAGLAALALTRRLVPDVPAANATRGGVDLLGAALVAAGLVAVVLPLIQGREQGWPLWTWLCLAAAGPVLGWFAVRQRRLAAAGREPLLRLDVFAERGFVPGLVAVALLFGASAGLSFVLALYLQEGLRLGPAAAGAVCTALNAGFFVASLRTGRLGALLGRGLPVAGALTLLLGLALLYGAGTPAAVVVSLLFTGAGMGLLMSPLLSSALDGVRKERAGAAAGVLGTVQETGGVLGGTVTSGVFLSALDGGWTAATHAALAVLIACVLGVLAYALSRAVPRPRARRREWPQRSVSGSVRRSGGTAACVREPVGR
ncbi:MFS transporter [Nonomuraea sp. NN258]|uniref:MFS transporter n=1 Tax=Nonomuraea antri TaxID=2730852 RepID=UPI001569A9D2|nr:MFS transporter [Nonomuraea antri]NRQ31620.1 MFS transporter [Nonomuraea antri]